MAIDALVKPFLALPLFRGLKPLQLTEIVRRADRIVFKAGDILISEDQPGDAAIVIVSGECVRVDGNDTGAPGEAIPEGSMIGEMAMLIDTTYATTVVARGQVRALRLNRSEMHELMAEDPKLAQHFTEQITSRLHKLADELRTIDQALADIAQFNPMDRIAAHDHRALALH